MSKILIKNAYVLTMKDGPVTNKLDCLVVDEKIAMLKENIDITDDITRVIDATDCVLMPSFKNAHTHSAMVFSRSSSDNLELSDWLTKCIFPMEDNLQEGDVYTLSKVAFLEYLTSGISACFDMYYTPLEIAKASEDFNFRTTILGTILVGRQSIEEICSTYDKINSSYSSLVSFRLGFHAEYTASDELLDELSKVSLRLKSPISTHASETLHEVEGCKERHNGLTPTEYIDSMKCFEYGGTLFHNIYLTENDMKIMKEKNIICVTCPGSNGKLASGISPISTLLDHSIKVAIGTDGAGSNNCLDMFKEMSLLFSFAKIHDNDAKSLSAYEILKMATINGSEAMGLKDVDTLEVNKYADLILIDLNKPNMQPINNIVANIVYSGSKDNIKMTMINGKVMYFDHKFEIDEDIKELYRKAQEISDRLNKDNPYKN